MGQDENKTHNGTGTQWIPLFVTNAVSLIGMFLLFGSNVHQGETQQMSEAFKTTIDRMKQQETIIAVMQAGLIKANVRIVDLERRLHKQQNDINLEMAQDLGYETIIQSLLDSLPFPAYIKIYNPETDQFTMWMINNAFVFEHGGTKARYVGQTDDGLWPDDVVAKYRKDDFYVLRNRYFLKTEEYETRRNTDGTTYLAPITTWKYYLKLPFDKEAVGGFNFRRENDF
jgi:hypothetical protein